ncbi:uncharacterized protein LOC123684068 isoform X2 [Harmonia axyridis]|uniref:uncharacterized protein LOC123684068 isoform X2 n=1 Tax=Harmonia axyridis TaxID=115357 RepID=UPI001E277123|nr:uncharacterized protein LOC123684068 isoform X2 [Harmonia axyridis]
MGLFIIPAILLYLICQAQAACVQDLMKLITHDVSKTELDLNVTIVEITNRIKNAKEDIDALILKSKLEIQSERAILEDLESAAYGRSMVEKKSIADCLENDRVQMKIINTTESIIYRLCRADLSILLVESSILSVELVSRELEKQLEICVNENSSNCEKEVACIKETLKYINDKLDDINTKVEERLQEIYTTSQICANGKKAMVISMIKEQESNFNYCVSKILKNV